MTIELQHLADRSEPGKALVVGGVLGGVERRLVTLASAPVVGRGAVLDVSSLGEATALVRDLPREPVAHHSA